MSGSYDESVGADDIMDSFWEVKTHRHVHSDGFLTCNTNHANETNVEIHFL